MDLNPPNCWHCPWPFGESLTWSVAILLVLWAGLRLGRSPRRIPRWAGVALKLLAGVATLFLGYGVQRFGIAWPGMDRWSSPRRTGLEVLFLAVLLAAEVCLVVRRRKRGASFSDPCSPD